MKKLLLIFISLTIISLNSFAQDLMIVSDEPVANELYVDEDTTVVESENIVQEFAEEEPMVVVEETSPVVQEITSEETRVFQEMSESTTTADNNGKLKYYEGGPFSHLSVGLNAGLYGFGLEVAAPLIPNIKMRAGFNYMGLKFREFEDIEFEYYDVDINDDRDASADIKPSFSFMNGKLMFDFLPWKKGVLAFTAGVYIGKNKVEVTGTAYDDFKNPLRHEAIDFGDDIVIYTDGAGQLDAELRLGNVVKPYFGITLGRAIPKHRVGFKFEIGAVYQGEMKLISDSVSGSIMNEMNDAKNSVLDDLPFDKKWLNFWPMMSIQLTYRIF